MMMASQITGTKINFFINGNHWEIKLDPDLTPYTILNSKCIRNPNANLQILEENMWIPLSSQYMKNLPNYDNLEAKKKKDC